MPVERCSIDYMGILFLLSFTVILWLFLLFFLILLAFVEVRVNEANLACFLFADCNQRPVPALLWDELAATWYEAELNG